jgi:acyl-CoA synthetase (AMP-forming)/AMP-acid ligase II
LGGQFGRNGVGGLALIYFRNDLPSVENYLACFRSGQAALLADAGTDPSFQQRLIAAYRPGLILSSCASDDAVFPEGEYRAHSAGEGRFCWRRREEPTGRPHPELGLLMTTSGSTGSPKVVRLSRRNVVANATSIARGLGLGPEHRPITSLPMHYSYGLSVLNSHLIGGAEIVLTGEGILSAGFWDIFRRHKCSSWAGVPYSYDILRRLDLVKLNLPSLRDLTQAGGRLHPDAIAHFHALANRLGARLWVMYGQTEATARISILPPQDLPEKLGSIGLPVEGGRWHIDPDEAHPRPEGAGQLVYSGPNVMMGYASSAEDLDAGDRSGQVLATGDVGYLDKDGYGYITGRLKRVAKLMGIRVDLDEIEELVRGDFPAAVIGNDEKIVIFSELRDESLFRTVRQRLSGQLRVHQSLFEFRTVGPLPLTANGKVDYPKLQGDA